MARMDRITWSRFGFYQPRDSDLDTADDLEIEGDGGADRVFGDDRIDAFARDWVRQWGIVQDPDAPDRSVNYRVMFCEPVAEPSPDQA